MKKLLTLLLLSFGIATTLSSQSIDGTWGGELKPAPTVAIKIIFNFEKTANEYTGKLDVPQQNAKGIPMTDISFANNKLSLKISMIGASFEGQLSNEGNKIEGTFTQNGMPFPITLEPAVVEKANRPQTPQPPFPYKSEEVTFDNKIEGFALAATLTMPHSKTKLPAVVMITGSGLQNRDEELFEHKPFAVIADQLSRNGIAVLRFDDRGYGQSGGDAKNATTRDFATDAQSAINYLKSRSEIDSKKIGLIGHSEGGNIAFITTATNPKDVAFIVSLAGMGETGEQTLMRQNELLSKAKGMTDEAWQAQRTTLEKNYAIFKQDKPIDEIKADYIAGMLSKAPLAIQQDSIQINNYKASLEAQTSPWLINFVKYNPAVELASVKCPVFILNGDKDIQVEAKANTHIIANSLLKAGNKKAEVKIYPNLNHLFQTCKTGMIEEYAQIEETISPQVLEDITQWIKKTAKIK